MAKMYFLCILVGIKYIDWFGADQLNKCWICVNEPQSYLKIQYSWNHPNLECFYLVIQVRSSGMNDIFGLAGTFVTWDSKQTSLEKSFWLQEGAEKKNNKNIDHGFDISPTLTD